MEVCIFMVIPDIDSWEFLMLNYIQEDPVHNVNLTHDCSALMLDIK